MHSERSTFDTTHQEDKGRVTRIMVLCLDSGKIECSEGGMKMEVQFGDIPRLAILQPRELLGISENKLDLKSQLVEAT